MRPGALLLAGLLAACAGPTPPRPPNMSPGFPSAEVRQPDDGPVEIVWGTAGALWVEVRHAATGRVVWRALSGERAPGRPAALLRSPLAVRALGPPPGVFPPDGRGPEAPAPEAFVPGDAYSVTVAPCREAPTACTPLPLHIASFTARRP